jgi:hypothetical protein
MIQTGEKGLGAFITEDNCDAWIVDFGAIKHMLNMREWMTNFVSIPIGNWLMATENDFKHWVERTGDVLIMTNIVIIAKVFYIPNLR